MKIVLASKNRHKIAELNALLREYIPSVEILSLDDVGFRGEIEENGKTFEDNAYVKALAAAETGYIGVGDDSGLCVRALNGEPGVYSARYAGVHGDDEANNALLLKKLADKDDKYAEFVCCIACVFPNDKENPHFFTGKVGGFVIDGYRGNGGFGYDPIFYYEPMNKTLAEMSAEEKNSISHRGRAIEQFAEFLKKYYEENKL